MSALVKKPITMGDFMKRMDWALQTSVAVIALASATAALAQSNLPPPDIANSQAPGAQQSAPVGPGSDIVITGSRIRHNPLDQTQPVTFVDKSDIQKTGLNSVSEVLQRLPSVGG